MHDEAFEMVLRTKKSQNAKRKSQKDNEPIKTPIVIPHNKQMLEKFKAKRKASRLLERQAIMYGIDCLEETLQKQN